MTLDEYIFYQGDSGILYTGNCIDIIKLLENNSLDMVFADPPYYMERSNFKIEEKSYKRVSEDWDNQWNNKDEYIEWLRSIFAALKPKMKKGCPILICSSFHNQSYVDILMKDFFTFRNNIIWKLTNSMPIKYAKQSGVYAYSYQFINYYSNGVVKTFNYDLAKQYNNGKQQKDIIELGDIIEIPNTPNNERITVNGVKHSTQKPEQLLDYLIKIHSNKNDLILDMFNGSGTTSRMAKINDRRFIGIDISKDYNEIAKQRLLNI